MILALDVGFRTTGFSIFNKGKIIALGCIETVPTVKKTIRVADDNARRAAEIAIKLKKIIEIAKVKGVVGELPSGAALSAKAQAGMALATGTVAATMAILAIPVEWVTPTDVKVVLTGKKSASKDEIMDAVREKYKGVDFPKGVAFPESKNKFEHVADSIGAYLAAEDRNVVKMYG